MQNRIRVLICVSVIIMLAALLCGCYSKTFALTGRMKASGVIETTDGQAIPFSVSVPCVRAWTRWYLFKPDGFPALVVNDPRGATKMFEPDEINPPELPGAEPPKEGDGT